MTKDKLVLILPKDSSSVQLQLMGVEKDAEVLDDAVLLKDGAQVRQVDARNAGFGHHLVRDALGVVGRVTVGDLYGEVLIDQSRKIGGASTTLDIIQQYNLKK